MNGRKKSVNECAKCGAHTTNPKFCSRKCSVTHNNNAKLHRCVRCGNATRRGEFCSTACKNNTVVNCKECGILTANKVFCSILCIKTYKARPEIIAYRQALKCEAWQRYQARKLRQTPPDADISMMQEIYQHCPKGYEVDHVIPLSRGGLHHQDNLQYLTISENRKKGNKLQ